VRSQNAIGYAYLFRFGAPKEALPHLLAAWQDDPAVHNAAHLAICHAALGDYESVEQLRESVEPRLDNTERGRFAALTISLRSRPIRLPAAAHQLPGADPESWNCPACFAGLIMPESAFLYTCGTAFKGVSECPCCTSRMMVGAGTLTFTGGIPPKCPICNAGVPMQHSRRKPAHFTRWRKGRVSRR
jgi:hypothetical protein